MRGVTGTGAAAISRRRLACALFFGSAQGGIHRFISITMNLL